MANLEGRKADFCRSCFTKLAPKQGLQGVQCVACVRNGENGGVFCCSGCLRGHWAQAHRPAQGPPRPGGNRCALFSGPFL